MMQFVVSLDGLDGLAVEYREAMETAIAKALGELVLPDATVTPTSIKVVPVPTPLSKPESGGSKLFLKAYQQAPVPLEWPLPTQGPGPEQIRRIPRGRSILDVNPPDWPAGDVDVARDVPARRGHHWTPAEDSQLRTEWVERVQTRGLTTPQAIAEIALVHNRTAVGIERRLEYLGLLASYPARRR